MQPDLNLQTSVRWPSPDPKHVPLLREAAITAVVAPPDEAFEKACREAGIQAIPEKKLEPVTLAAAGKAKPGAMTVVNAGLWPGVQRPDPQVASATRSLWLDQNCGLLHYVRALYPAVPRVLAYQPDKEAGVSPDQLVPYEALELALTEACVSGGNYLMALHPQYREALLKGDAKALAAWRKQGRTAQWLRANAQRFQQPALPLVAVLVDEGDFTREIVHLAFRQSVSPEVIAAAHVPAPDPGRRRVVVAVSLTEPPAEVRQRILAHADAGSTLVVDGPLDKAWWKSSKLVPVRSDPDRDYYSLGKGQVIAYKESVEDPGQLALDMIDYISQKLRPARIWNCNAGLVLASRSTLAVINYSRPQDQPVLARIQGTFKRATLLRPEGDAVELRVAPRGSASEVAIPQLERVAVVTFA